MKKILVLGSCTNKKQKVACKAREIYLGQQHTLTCKAVDSLRNQGYNVDFYILSALHGFVEENTVLEPYNVTWAGMKKADIANSTQHLHKEFEELVSQYDTVILLLGKEYLIACGTEGKKFDNIYAFTSNSTKKLIDCKQWVLKTEDCGKYGAPVIALKGKVFSLLVDQLENDLVTALKKNFK